MGLKISFPSMGYGKVAFSALLDTIPGVELFYPPDVNREIVKLGSLYSPEFVCWPFKITLGEFLYMHKKHGVKNFMQATDCGPCRFGFYAPVQERILDDLGHNIKILPLYQADLGDSRWIELYQTVAKLAGTKITQIDIAYAARLFFLKAMHLERIRRLAGLIRSREKEKGTTNKVMKYLLETLKNEKNVFRLHDFKSIINQTFKKVKIDRKKEPLRVFFTGEIHLSLENFANMDVVKKLGEEGVEIHLGTTVYDWVKHKSHINGHRKELAKIAHQYIPMDIGGEAQWVMGDFIKSQREGFDGFIHVYPFTCMPEISVRGIIEGQSPDPFYLPIQFYSLDEHTGFEGMRTRLEAFIELMKTNREHNPKFQNRYQEPELIKEIWNKPRTTKSVFTQSIIKFFQPLFKLTERFGGCDQRNLNPHLAQFVKVLSLIIVNIIVFKIGLKDVIDYLSLFVKFLITKKVPEFSFES